MSSTGGVPPDHGHRLADLVDLGRARVDSLSWPLTISHRGGPGVYPEHSWEAKTGSVDYGFVPEFDLRLLADGRTLVNCHDDTVDRTMNNIGTGLVSDKTSGQWQRARIKPAIPGGAEGRPVFWDEVLDRWGGRVVLVAELKDPAGLDVFVHSVVSRGIAPSVLAQSFDLAVAARLVAAGIETLYLCDTIPPETPAQIKAAGINYFGGNVATTPTATLRAMEGAGIRTIGYTVHTLSEATTPEALVWDGLFSDDAWRTTESIPIRSGDRFADGIRPYGMDVYCLDASTRTMCPPSVPIRLVGRRLGFSQPSPLVPYASQPWAGKLLARPLRVSLRLWFGTGGEQTAGLGFLLSTAASGPFLESGRAGQQAFGFEVRRNGQLRATRYPAGRGPVEIGATTPVPGQAYAPPGWEASVDLSVLLEQDRIVLQAQGGSGSAPAQQLVIDNADPGSGLELYLRWMAATAGASGFISDIDVAPL
jgi:glycerophosphoryl diester phosphodiesterase